MEKLAYEAPQVEIAEVAVEQGIAISSTVNSTTATEDYKWKDEMGW